MSLDTTRPPYVQFETREVEDRDASIKAGHYVSKDVHIAVIMRPGSRDSVEKDAQVWLAELRAKARDGQVPQVWYDGFSDAYKRWQAGEEGAVKGTPIKTWPVLSPSARKDLLQAGVQTVEDLAQLPDGELGSIGTGAMLYKQKALAWLASANDHGKVTEQMVALAGQVKELTDLVRKQADENNELRAKLNPLVVEAKK